MTSYNIKNSTVYMKDETFKNCIGSCHAYLTLREDYREHVKQVQKEIGFHSIRFHGILHDLVGVYHGKIKDKDTFNMQNVFKIFDFFLENDMKPFIELGFMPEELASGSKTVFKYKANVTPPQDYERWNSLVKTFASELINRYSLNEVLTWKFEVWNEPDLKNFWHGDINEYFKLYANTASTLKQIDERILVGGPATSGIKWIDETIKFCEENNVPIDFFSTHHYCSSIAFEPHVEIDRAEFKAHHDQHYMKKDVQFSVYRGQHNMKKDVEKVYNIIKNSKFKDTPIYFTEWNVSPVHEDVYAKDSEFTATFVLSTLSDVSKYVDGYSYWTISDIFEESGPSLYPFTGKYGLININNIKKPVYYAYKYLEELYPHFIEHNYDNTYISKSYDDNLKILTWNHPKVLEVGHYGDDYEVDNTQITRNLSISGLNGNYRIRAWLVDKDHGNALTEWKKLDKPQYLSEEQIITIQKNSQPHLFQDEIICISDKIELKSTLQGASFIFYDIEKVM